jgi:hypothetical protein
MTHESTGPVSAIETEFDPDSQKEQPESALQSLIERIENEVRSLQLNQFSHRYPSKQAHSVSCLPPRSDAGQ